MENDDQKTNDSGDFDEFMKKVNNLPDFVYDAIMGVEGTKANGEISEKFKLSDDQKSEMLSLISEITFKDIPIENLSSETEKRLKVNQEIAKQISLELLQKEFFLVKDYFPGIEDAITSLGGDVPKIIPKKQTQDLVDEEKIEERQRQTVKERIEAEAKREKVVQHDIKTLLKEYAPAGEQAIGQNSIEAPSVALPVKPKIKYWIECYKEATGYGWNTNMERVKFIYHNKNTRGMNEEERRQLGLVLKSLDEGTPLAYLEKGKRIDFSEGEIRKLGN